MFFGKHKRKVIGEGIVVLPIRFHPGKVTWEEDCLTVVPEWTGKVIVLTKEDLNYAGIKEDVLIVGHGLYYRIWNPEKFLEKNRPKKERRLIEMAKHLHIKRREGQWGLMIPKDFDRLLKEMKKGEVVAVSAEGITEEEKEKIRAEGFGIFPQQLTVGRAPRHQAIDILNIR